MPQGIISSDDGLIEYNVWRGEKQFKDDSGLPTFNSWLKYQSYLTGVSWINNISSNKKLQFEFLLYG